MDHYRINRRIYFRYFLVLLSLLILAGVVYFQTVWSTSALLFGITGNGAVSYPYDYHIQVPVMQEHTGTYNMFSTWKAPENMSLLLSSEGNLDVNHILIDGLDQWMMTYTNDNHITAVYSIEYYGKKGLLYTYTSDTQNHSFLINEEKDLTLTICFPRAYVEPFSPDETVFQLRTLTAEDHAVTLDAYQLFLSFYEYGGWYQTQIIEEHHCFSITIPNVYHDSYGFTDDCDLTILFLFQDDSLELQLIM